MPAQNTTEANFPVRLHNRESTIMSYRNIILSRFNLLILSNTAAFYAFVNFVYAFNLNAIIYVKSVQDPHHPFDYILNRAYTY